MVIEVRGRSPQKSLHFISTILTTTEGSHRFFPPFIFARFSRCQTTTAEKENWLVLLFRYAGPGRIDSRAPAIKKHCPVTCKVYTLGWTGPDLGHAIDPGYNIAILLLFGERVSAVTVYIGYLVCRRHSERRRPRLHCCRRTSGT